MARERSSPWAKFSAERRASALAYDDISFETRQAFRVAQQEAYAMWSEWDGALGEQGDEAPVLPAFPVRELAGKLWRVLGETLKSFTVGDLSWQPIGATLGTESMDEREAQQNYFCPSLEEIPGIDPTLTISCRRRGGEVTIHFLLYPQKNGQPPSDLLIDVRLRRVHPKQGHIESVEVQFNAQELTRTVQLKDVVNREQWELEIQRLELVDQG